MPNGFQRFIQHIAATRPGTWINARVLHHLDKPILKATNYRVSATELLSGLKVVLVKTRGAKTGKDRTLPLGALVDDERLVLVASNFGQSHHPGWAYNIIANPEVTVFLDGCEVKYLARIAGSEEWEKHWQAFTEVYFGYERYKERASERDIKIFVLEPVKISI